MQFRIEPGGRIEALDVGLQEEAIVTAMMTRFANSAPIAAATPETARTLPAGVRAILKLEGAAALAAAVALYAHAGLSWPLFALLILAPDLSMLAYLLGPRAGAAAYNSVHT